MTIVKVAPVSPKLQCASNGADLGRSRISNLVSGWVGGSYSARRIPLSFSASSISFGR